MENYSGRDWAKNKKNDSSMRYNILVTRWFPLSRSDFRRTTAILDLVYGLRSQSIRTVVIVARTDISKFSIALVRGQLVIGAPWRKGWAKFYRRATVNRVLARKAGEHSNLSRKFFWKVFCSSRAVICTLLNLRAELRNLITIKVLQKMLAGYAFEYRTVHGDLLTGGAIIQRLLGNVHFSVCFHEADTKNRETKPGLKVFGQSLSSVGYRSSKIRAALLENYSDLCFFKNGLIGSGISEHEICEPDHRLIRSPESCLRLVTAARLIERKRVEHLLNVVKQCKFNWTLDIFGDGPLRSEIKNKIGLEGLNDSVSLKGRVPREEFMRELPKYDIFILLSTDETLGLCYLEAVSKSVIVIGSKGEGLSDYIDHGVNGFLVDPNDDVMAVQTLAKIFEMPEEDIWNIKRRMHELALNIESKKMSERYKNIMMDPQKLNYVE